MKNDLKALTSVFLWSKLQVSFWTIHKFAVIVRREELQTERVRLYELEKFLFDVELLFLLLRGPYRWGGYGSYEESAN